MEVGVKHPASATQAALARERRRRRSWAAIFLLLPLLGVGGLGALAPGRRWGWVQPGALLAALLGAALAAYQLYRCALPHTSLARSLLPCLPPGEGLPGLLERIDADMAQGCRRFGPLYIGQVWVLGGSGVRLPAVCGVFSWALPGKGALCLVEQSGRAHRIPLSKRQLQGACAYLAARLPHAARGGWRAYRAFLLLRAEERLLYLGKSCEAGRQPLAFWGPDGIPTSHFQWRDVETALASLTAGETVGLALTEPIPLPTDGEATGLFVQPGEGAGSFLLILFYRSGEERCRAVQTVEREGAQLALRVLYEEGRLPALAGFTHQVWVEEPEGGYILEVDSQAYENNAFADVQATLEGMEGGLYSSLSLMLPDRRTGGLFVDSMGQGYRVQAAVSQEGGEVRWFEAISSRQDQVLLWLHDYYTHSQLPYLSGWEDITQRMEAARRRRYGEK